MTKIVECDNNGKLEMVSRHHCRPVPDPPNRLIIDQVYDDDDDVVEDELVVMHNVYHVAGRGDVMAI